LLTFEQGYKLRDMIAEVDTDNNKTVEFDEFIEMMKKVKSSGGKVVSQFAKARSFCWLMLSLDLANLSDAAVLLC